MSFVDGFLNLFKVQDDDFDDDYDYDDMMMTKVKSRLPERSYFQVLRNQMMKI